MTNIALIIDDEPDIRELLVITIKRMGINSYAAENLRQARALLKRHHFNICLTDMKLPDGDGLDFVSEVQRAYPHMPIAVITAHGSIDNAIMALKSGAFDFLIKPIDLKTLRTIIKNALNIRETIDKPKYRLIGNSPQMLNLKAMIKKVSKSQAPVCISGESGTGKELVARMIHEYSPRADQAFIAINCGAIPDNLLESEFFGYVKGSFTGATANQDGLFVAADGGTLFLDEVADLPQHMQVKLLRAIQEKMIRPLGAQKEIGVDVRILSATNKDLQTLVNESEFRQDLFYRINVIVIRVPPLRERTADLELLVDHLLEKISDQKSTDCPKLSKAALKLLREYSFPGNIRELENILERTLAMSGGNVIDVHDLHLTVAHENQEVELSESDHDIDSKSTNGHNVTGANDLESLLHNVERRQILQALEKTRWNKTAAAKLLGISFRALRYRLEKLKLE